MVDTLRKQPWRPPPQPLSAGGTRQLPGPIYDLAAVQACVNGERVFLASPRCAAHVGGLEWDTDDVAALVRALATEDYQSSAWCAGAKGRVVLDADAYVIRYDPIGQCRGHPWRHERYYIKFGFRPDDDRLILWAFSCHRSISCP